MILIRKSTIEQVETKKERKIEREVKNALLKVKKFAEIEQCKNCHSIYIGRLKDIIPSGDNYTLKCPSCGLEHIVDLIDILNSHGINSLILYLNIIGFSDKHTPFEYKKEIHEYIKKVLIRKK